MNKKITLAEADRRGLRLYRRLRQIEAMDKIRVAVPTNDPPRIIIWDRNDDTCFKDVTVETILSLDVKEAEKKGGTFEALLTSRKAAKPRPSVGELEDTAQPLLSGDETQELRFPIPKT